MAKNSLDELKNSELRYRRLFETAKDGILLIDFKTGMILDVNQFLIDLLDYSKEDFLEKYLWEVGVFKDIAASKENFQTLQKKRYVRFEDLPLETKTGNKVEVEFVANAYQVGEDTIIQCNIRDITERKRTERKAKGKYQELIENISDVFFAMDKNLRYTYWNQASEKLTGIPAEKAIGKTLLEVMPDNEARQQMIGKCLQVIKDVKPQSWIVNYPGDQHIVHEISAYPTTEGISVFAKDITERKKAEVALSESENHYRQIIETMQEGFGEIDSALRIVSANKRCAEMFGYTLDEFIGLRMVEDLILPADRGVILEQMEQRRRDKIGIYEQRFRRKDGTALWVIVSGTPIKDESGTVLGSFAMMTDITERKEAEESLSRLAMMVENTSDYASVADLNGNLLYLNQGGKKMVGLDENTDISKLKIVNMHPGWAIKIIQEEGIPEALKTGLWRGETALLNHDGHEIPVSQVIMTHKNNEGKVDILATIMRDITQAKHDEAVLKESRERYKTLVDAAPLCIKWFDSEGNLISINKHGRVEHHLEGKSEEEIKDWPYMGCIEPKYHQIVKDGMAKALRGEEGEFDMEHVPGTSTGHWCHSVLVPAKGSDGKVKYVLFISRDVDAEKELDMEKNKMIAELEKFKELTVGRELKMVELKKEISELKKKEGLA